MYTKSVTLKRITYILVHIRSEMSRMYNTVGAPGEFFPLASIVKRQLIYYFYMSKLIYPTCKLLNEVYYCQTKRVGDKYKFFLSQFVQ